MFRGVPFAQPPVGGLRWRAPQPALPWDGVLQAFDFGPTAMQPTPGASDDFYDREWGTDPAVPMSEDCLYLNIWTPALRGYGADSMVASEKLPVMVWIYGGAINAAAHVKRNSTAHVSQRTASLWSVWPIV